MKKTSLDILVVAKPTSLSSCEICGLSTNKNISFSKNGKHQIFKVCTLCKIYYRQFYRGFLVDKFHPKKHNIKITRYDEFNDKAYYENGMNNNDVYGGWDHPKKFFMYSLFKLNFELLRTAQIFLLRKRK